MAEGPCPQHTCADVFRDGVVEAVIYFPLIRRKRGSESGQCEEPKDTKTGSDRSLSFPVGLKFSKLKKKKTQGEDSLKRSQVIP